MFATFLIYKLYRTYDFLQVNSGLSETLILQFDILDPINWRNTAPEYRVPTIKRLLKDRIITRFESRSDDLSDNQTRQ